MPRTDCDARLRAAPLGGESGSITNMPKGGLFWRVRPLQARLQSVQRLGTLLRDCCTTPPARRADSDALRPHVPSHNLRLLYVLGTSMGPLISLCPYLGYNV